MKIRIYTSTTLTTVAEAAPGLPLWQLAPTARHGRGEADRFHDADPAPAHMAKYRDRARIARHTGRVVLHQDVVFADLNLKLNLLWVSLRPRQGAISELAAAIRLRVPEAVLVAHYAEPR